MEKSNNFELSCNCAYRLTLVTFVMIIALIYMNSKMLVTFIHSPRSSSSYRLAISAMTSSSSSHSSINETTFSSSFVFLSVNAISFSTSLPTVIISSSYSTILASDFSISSSIFCILFGALNANFLFLSCSAFSSGVNSVTASPDSLAPVNGVDDISYLSQSLSCNPRSSMVNLPSLTVPTCVKPTCSQNALSWETTTTDPSLPPQFDKLSPKASIHS
mmetsp:Transcript_35262/g.51834  ORF Transcript_35262/g.51834 Transcript_35262/m.51834 type:complete len:218 (-) Transcript_35262:1384-2037(-)